MTHLLRRKNLHKTQINSIERYQNLTPAEYKCSEFSFITSFETAASSITENTCNELGVH
jgi:hypothetical protein